LPADSATDKPLSRGHKGGYRLRKSQSLAESQLPVWSGKIQAGLWC